MNSLQPSSAGSPARFAVAVLLAQLLERLDRSAVPVGAEQYRSVVRHLAEELEALQSDSGTTKLLDAFPSAAELYENLNYRYAGLCRSPLELSLDAEQQARKVSGVKSVQNELQVVPDVAAKRVEARDDQLLDAVEKRLGGREALKDNDIDVEVKNGVVRLTGSVDGFGERMTALTVARSTEGVKSVIDDLRIEKKG